MYLQQVAWNSLWFGISFNFSNNNVACWLTLLGKQSRFGDKILMN